MQAQGARCRKEDAQGAQAMGEKVHRQPAMKNAPGGAFSFVRCCFSARSGWPGTVGWSPCQEVLLYMACTVEYRLAASAALKIADIKGSS
jgi:hypothetical protein